VGHHNGHGVNESHSVEDALWRNVLEDLFDEGGKDFMESVEALDVAAVAGQVWKPGGQMVGDIGVYGLDGSVLFDDAEEIDCEDLLIGESGLVIVAQALGEQAQAVLVVVTDVEIESN